MSPGRGRPPALGKARESGARTDDRLAASQDVFSVITCAFSSDSSSCIIPVGSTGHFHIERGCLQIVLGSDDITRVEARCAKQVGRWCSAREAGRRRRRRRRWWSWSWSQVSAAVFVGSCCVGTRTPVRGREGFRTAAILKAISPRPGAGWLAPLTLPSHRCTIRWNVSCTMSPVRTWAPLTEHTPQAYGHVALNSSVVSVPYEMSQPYPR